MGLNTGYLKADRTEESNEQYTPYYAVDPILKYIPKGARVWTPFDREWSAFYQSFKAGGIFCYTVGYIGRAGLFHIRAAGI